jgi:hypothetical protein
MTIGRFTYVRNLDTGHVGIDTGFGGADTICVDLLIVVCVVAMSVSLGYLAGEVNYWWQGKRRTQDPDDPYQRTRK